MICFQISIFEPLETTFFFNKNFLVKLWFAFKLVSLNHWKQHPCKVMHTMQLWFAFKLVSLNHWKQRHEEFYQQARVVICFQISIFEPLETTFNFPGARIGGLWFAFKLVSLNHWKQRRRDLHLLVFSCDLLSN